MMNFSLSLLVFLGICSAVAAPVKVGSRVKYVTKSDSSNYLVEENYRINGESEIEKRLYLVAKTTSDDQRFTYWLEASKIYDNKILSRCRKNDGVIEVIETPAGRFRACRTQITIKRKNRVVSIEDRWEGKVPFKLIRSSLFSTASRTTVLKELVELKN